MSEIGDKNTAACPESANIKGDMAHVLKDNSCGIKVDKSEHKETKDSPSHSLIPDKPFAMTDHCQEIVSNETQSVCSENVKSPPKIMDSKDNCISGKQIDNPVPKPTINIDCKPSISDGHSEQSTLSKARPDTSSSDVKENQSPDVLHQANSPKSSECINDNQRRLLATATVPVSNELMTSNTSVPNEKVLPDTEEDPPTQNTAKLICVNSSLSHKGSTEDQLANLDDVASSTVKFEEDPNNQRQPALQLVSLRVNLPDIEKSKSDIACAPEPVATTKAVEDVESTNKLDTDKVASTKNNNSNKSATESDAEPPESVYQVKWVQFKGKTTAIVTQNENGPCPLLAIMNCLLLQGRIKLPSMVELVTSSQLMEYLGDCILGNTPKNITEDALLNYEQNMQDAMDVFHKLQTGLDVNVRFTGVNDFEYTRESIVFDLLNIPLYHGWLVDPESPEVVAAVGNCSYNQLVEKIISQKNSNCEELMTEALIAEEYLERSAAQLTYHGLSELVTTVKEDELCVFFRNNHFSALYKHKKELFLLVTDQGFLTETNVVWETLANVEGDGHFVDMNFRTFRKPEVSTAPIAVPEVPLGTGMQIDQDYLVALSLQEEQQSDQQPVPNVNAQQWQQPMGPGLEPTLSDHELALQLQEEEHRRAATAGGTGKRGAHAGEHRQASSSRTALQHQASTASSSGGSGTKRDKNCAIL